jgi:DNA-binding response OmpR family regulator
MNHRSDSVGESGISLREVTANTHRSTYGKTAGSRGKSGTETILVIEDEHLVRKMVRRLLNFEGYRVLEAQDGQEALAVAATCGAPIHLVLSDVVLPGLSGPQVVARLKEQAVCSRVLFMSGYAQEELLKKDGLGSSDHSIQKPFDGDALARKVREVLDV